MLLSGFRLELIFDLKGDKIRRDEVDFFNLVDEFGSALGSGFDGDVHASIFQYLNIIIVIGFKLYFNNKCICIYFKKHKGLGVGVDAAFSLFEKQCISQIGFKCYYVKMKIRKLSKEL